MIGVHMLEHGEMEDRIKHFFLWESPLFWCTCVRPYWNCWVDDCFLSIFLNCLGERGKLLLSLFWLAGSGIKLVLNVYLCHKSCGKERLILMLSQQHCYRGRRNRKKCPPRCWDWWLGKADFVLGENASGRVPRAAVALGRPTMKSAFQSCLYISILR